MHHQGIQFLAVVRQRPKTYPVNQLVAIVLAKNFPQGIETATRNFYIVGQREQMQIMIAENSDRRSIETLNKAQGFS